MSKNLMQQETRKSLRARRVVPLLCLVAAVVQAQTSPSEFPTTRMPQTHTPQLAESQPMIHTAGAINPERMQAMQMSRETHEAGSMQASHANWAANWSANREGSATRCLANVHETFAGFDISKMGALQAGYADAGGKRGDTDPISTAFRV